MNPHQIDLALRKQKLQMQIATQRADMTRRLPGIDGALDCVDSLREHLAWAKDKIPLLSAALIVVLLAKPKLTLRLARRAWVSWLLARQLRGGRFAALLPGASESMLRGAFGHALRQLAA